jgi:hypothetical protein
MRHGKQTDKRFRFKGYDRPPYYGEGGFRVGVVYTAVREDAALGHLCLLNDQGQPFWNETCFFEEVEQTGKRG